MMNHILTQQLLSLIRTALWNENPDIGLFNKDTDWEHIAMLANKQTVLGIVADGIKGIPNELKPNNEFLSKLKKFRIKNIMNHELLNNVIEDINGKLRGEGIHCVLLKGQGLARNYPIPESRMCGDIDLYVGNENYKKVRSLLKQWGMLDGIWVESYQHLHFKYRGVAIEIHRIAGIIHNPLYNMRFKKWYKSQLDKPTDRICVFGNENVNLPPIRFDALFIFYHFTRHLISGGVGLRQLLDCAIFLNKYKDEIDTEKLKNDINLFGLMQIWQVYGYIAVNYLGLPKESFPFYIDDKKTAASAEFVFNDIIMKYGNFGFFNPELKKRPEGFLSGKLFSFRRNMAYLVKCKDAFVDNVVFYALFYIFNGMCNIIKFKKK